MRIERLTLQGFLRFRDRLTIDLRDVPDGLVAIVGPNGAGKTTLLEAAPAALYRSFMSRGDITQYATDRDSFLELDLAVDGQGSYRARVNVDGVKRSSDAVLQAVLPGGGTRVLNDGKVSTFDTVVAATFPSKELLLASAFTAQSRAGSFISLDKKGRKTLFAQLLGIERYAAMSETARQAAQQVEMARLRVQAQRDVLTADTADGIREQLHALANQLQVDGGRAQLRRTELDAQIADLEARLASMADAVSAYAAAEQRVHRLEMESQRLTAEAQALGIERIAAEQMATADEHRLTSQRDATVHALRTVDTARADAARDLETRQAEARRDEELADIDKKLAGNEQLLGMADRIRTAVTTAERLRETVATLERSHAARRETLDADQQQWQDYEKHLGVLRSAEERLTRARADAGLMSDVPCGGKDACADCQFLANARQAQVSIPHLEAEVGMATEMRAQQQTVTDRIVEHRTALSDLHTQLTQARTALTETESLTRYAEPLAAAEARMGELRERRTLAASLCDQLVEQATARHLTKKAAIGERIATTIDAAAADLQIMQARLADRCADIARRLAMLEQAEAATQAAWDDARADLEATADKHQRVARLKDDLAATRAERDQVTQALARVEAGRDELGRRRQEFQAKRDQLAAVRDRLARLDTELIEWQLLAKAFGANGLPVLEIDAAGPTISAYTNELLEACFGPRFSVELVTQVAKADGKGAKEDFSIRVTDNTRGGESRDIADLSGGEQVIVAEALSNAISIYVNTRSATPMRTCWRDETTGALDPDNAARYMAMLRKVQQLGGFQHVIFISHNPDAAAQADAQIQLQDGTARLAYPPFAAREAA